MPVMGPILVWRFGGENVETFASDADGWSLRRSIFKIPQPSRGLARWLIVTAVWLS